MSDARDLYQEQILDHYKNPRNYHAIDKADRKAEGYNPLCGDTIHLYLVMDGETVKDVAFEGNGCAISKASASMMTGIIKGKTLSQIRQLFDQFHAMITSEPHTPVEEAALGKLAVFAGVREYPARVKCAVLAWHTLKEALEGSGKTVTTEAEERGGVNVTELRKKVIEAIKLCYDPEIPVNVYDMGLIYDVNVEPTGAVNIQMTLTSPYCPVAGSLPMDIQNRVQSVEEVTSANVQIVWDPPWDPSKMSEAARLELGM